MLSRPDDELFQGVSPDAPAEPGETPAAPEESLLLEASPDVAAAPEPAVRPGDEGETLLESVEVSSDEGDASVTGDARDVADAPAADDQAADGPHAGTDTDHDIDQAHDDADAAHGADAAGPAHAAPTTVAELIAGTLRSAGVRVAFTVPGESFLPVLDALHAVGVRIVATRHEGAAAMAAEAYGQLTGRPAVCLGTRAVGASNLAVGIHTASADSTPMFVLVGQVRTEHRGQEAFQEVDLAGSIGKLARWAGEIDDPCTAAALLEEATRHALGGRPGPVLLALPEDVLEMALPEGTAVPVVRPRTETPDMADLRAALHFLAAAERPVILAGAGVLRARCSNDLVRLAELLHVPVIASWRRGDVISNDHPLYLGMTGYGSPSTVRERLAASDAILVLGSRLNEITTYGYAVPAPGQAWMHVDLAPLAEGNGTIPAPVRAIRADARAFVRAALTRLRQAVLAAEPLAARDAHNAADRDAWERASVVDAVPWSGPGVHPGRIIADLRRVLPDDAIVTTDAGSFAGWAARGYRFRRPGTFLGPTSGAMGYAVPAALAAALVHRERRVVALVGDGGMGMTMAELETAVREQAHLVVVVFDNEQYGMIRLHQDRQGSPTSPGTDLGPLDFTAVARACGARGVRVETNAAFEGALRTALAASVPTVIQLPVDRRWTSVDAAPGDVASAAG